MVVTTVHLGFDIVAYPVDKVNLEERFPADKVPYHALVCKVRVCLPVQYVVNRRLGGTPRHPLLFVLPHQIAVLARQLTVLGNYKGNVFSSSVFPTLVIRLYNHAILSISYN